MGNDVIEEGSVWTNVPSQTDGTVDSSEQAVGTDSVVSTKHGWRVDDSAVADNRWSPPLPSHRLSTSKRAGILGFVIGMTVVGTIASVLHWFPGAVAQSTSVQSNSLAAQSLQATASSNPGVTQSSTTTLIMIDVKGDVRHPGVVQVPFDARVKDVIAAAGGFVHALDAGTINLAAPVNDGDELLVPNATLNANGQTSSAEGAVAGSAGNVKNQSESSSVPGQSGGAAQTAGVKPNRGPIDLNTADVATLQTIPGVGPARAQAIVAYRQTNGPFQSIQDLDKVTGIGEVTLSHISAYVVVQQLGNGQ